MEANSTSLSPTLRRLILERDEFTCTECGQQVPKVLLYIDKILSPETEEAFAGQPEEDKYTCLCESCYKQAHGHLQFKAATRTAERRQQLEMMVEWRREKRGLESDTTAYLIDYINGKIEPYSLTKQGVHNVRKAIGKNNFTSALDAIDETYNHYVYFDGDDIVKTSVDEFLDKIGGYLYINSLPPVEREMYHVLNCCKARFNYWDKQKAKQYIQDYVDALRAYGWDEIQILHDLKSDLLKESNKTKNWSQWTDLMFRWTDEIRGWKKESAKTQTNKDRLRYEGEQLTGTLYYDIAFANEAFRVLKFFYEHMTGSTETGWTALANYVEDALFRFLLDMRDEFKKLGGIPLKKEDILEGYIDCHAFQNLIRTYPVDADWLYNELKESRSTDFPGFVLHHFCAYDCDSLLREIFNYFNLPAMRLDYQSCLDSLDYYIKNYREVFDTKPE